VRLMANVDRHPKSGLYRIKATYPKHLHAILKATGTTKTLGTRNAVVARSKASPVLAAMQLRISQAEAIYQAQKTTQVAAVLLPLETGIRLIEEWRDDYLRTTAKVMSTWEGSAGDYLALSHSREHDRAILNANPELMAELYYLNQPVPRDILDRTLDRLLAASGHLLPSRHPMRNVLGGALRTAISVIRQREEEWQNGGWTSDPLPPSAAPEPNLMVNAPVSDQGHTVPVGRKIRLAALVEAYVERTKPKPQSISEQKLAIRQLVNIIGLSDPFIHEITFDQAELFYNTLKWLPKSMTTADASGPLMHVADDMRSGVLQRPRAAIGTAAKKWQLVNAMFSYAASRGLLPLGNPFARLAGPRDSKPQVKRRPLRAADLTAIFSAPLFTGCSSYKGWRKPGQILVANHRFWLPLLAMVTGCRLEELGQLLVSDVGFEDGVLFVRLTEEVEHDEKEEVGTKSLKTEISSRCVPLHHSVIDAGFETYWRWLASMGVRRLFPEFPAETKKTKEMSRWFNRDFRRTVDMTDPTRTFHSFRHMFKDRCRAAKLRRDLHDALTGHADGSASEGYGDGLELADLKDGIDSLTFPGFPGVPCRKGLFNLDSDIGVMMA